MPPSLPPPRALLLDLGDTLLRERGYDLGPGLVALEPTAPAAELSAELDAEIAHVHATGSTEFTLRRWLDRRRGAFARPGDADELERAFWRACARLSPMAGVAEALDAFAASGLRLACVSNAVFSARILESELERHGLRGGLRFVLSSADLGTRKPARAIFRHALAELGASAEETWFVGDSWENDVCGAARAGLFPVWLSRSAPPAPEPAHARAASWEDVRELVARALGGARGARA